MWHRIGAGATLAHYAYAYNAGGDVTSRVDSDGTTTTFGYDASDQLTSEVRAGGYSIAYAYDHNHNRLSKTTNGTAEPYTYDAHDKLLSAGAKTYAYDLDGNCTSVSVGSSVTHLAYDVLNRVSSITYPNNATNSFAYNGEDLRVAKTDSRGTRNYVTDGASPASAVLSDGAAIYTPGLSERRGGSSKFYHKDALGSTRGITDSSQTVTDSQVYDAFGNTVSRTGTTPTPFGFVGKSQYQTDGDSGLQLLGHRYYDPSVGRFLSSDPAKAGTNWYAYCENNPLGKTDPMGLLPDIDDIIAWGIDTLVPIICVDNPAFVIPVLIGNGLHAFWRIVTGVNDIVNNAAPMLQSYVNRVQGALNGTNPPDSSGGGGAPSPSPSPPSPPPPPPPPPHGYLLPPPVGDGLGVPGSGSGWNPGEGGNFGGGGLGSGFVGPSGPSFGGGRLH